MKTLPDHVDSTMFAAFNSCPYAFYLQYVEHWNYSETERTGPVHLMYGSAIASAIEMMRHAVFVLGWTDPNRIISKGILAAFTVFGERNDHRAKHTRNLVRSVLGYYAIWPVHLDQMKPLRHNDWPWIETTFSIPLEITNQSLGKPFIFAGTPDYVTSWGDNIYIVDEKTTTAFGSTWGVKWGLRGQFTGYCWALQQMGYKTEGAIVRGIKTLTLSVEFLQTIYRRTHTHVEDWYRSRLANLKMMNIFHNQDYWPMNHSESCSQYSGCRYFQICHASEDMRQLLLEDTFVKKRWKPETRTWEQFTK